MNIANQYAEIAKLIESLEINLINTSYSVGDIFQTDSEVFIDDKIRFAIHDTRDLRLTLEKLQKAIEGIK